jgi:hypothetical protein
MVFDQLLAHQSISINANFISASERFFRGSKILPDFLDMTFVHVVVDSEIDRAEVWLTNFVVGSAEAFVKTVSVGADREVTERAELSPAHPAKISKHSGQTELGVGLQNEASDMVARRGSNREVLR